MELAKTLILDAEEVKEEDINSEEIPLAEMKEEDINSEEIPSAEIKEEDTNSEKISSEEIKEEKAERLQSANIKGKSLNTVYPVWLLILILTILIICNIHL